MAIQTLLIAIAMAALLMSAGMALAWIIQQRTGQSGWVDACWTFSVGLACVTIALAAAHGSAQSERALLVAALIAFWSLRLGVHIVVRTRGSGDDPRYAKMREEWGDEAPRRMFTLLQLQAVASLPLLLSVAVAASNSTRALGLQDLVAVLIFLGGSAGEGLSDAQLRAFARTPANRGQVCRNGLWGWSRHPNYFFEWLVWLALPVFAINLDGSHPWGWVALTAPAVMYWLLTRVSGIPLLEEHMVAKYGDPYRDYQRTTNAFYPMPPRI